MISHILTIPNGTPFSAYKDLIDAFILDNMIEPEKTISFQADFTNGIFIFLTA